MKNYCKSIVLILCLIVISSCKAGEEDNGPVPAVDLVLEKNSVELTGEDDKAIVKIVSGNGDYRISSSPKGIVNTSLKNNEVIISGIGCGNTVVTITDGRERSATIEVSVNMVSEREPSFREDFNTIDEKIWIIGTWFEHDGQLARSRCFTKDGFLNLLWKNETGPNPPWLGSAIQTRLPLNFLYGKWEVRLKASSVPGVLNSFYTIDWRDGKGTKQEIDIEFLTYTFGENKGKVHFALHQGDNKNDEGGNNSIGWNKDLDFNPSDDFHVWGFSVYPDKIEWFVDGEILHTYVYDKIKIDAPYELKLNHWSRKEWVNGPPAVGVESQYLIDWIQFTPFE